jgi:hypothetical protein
MQFKHPEILYALFFLIVPIIVHLFQLQRFVKVPFTNVKLLKSIEQQTRKSKQLKKWLILITRLFIVTSVVLAFAQPYFSEYNAQKAFNTTIYLDNSYSMQAKGKKGELLKSAVKNIIENTENSKSTFSLITNNKHLTNLDATGLKDALLAVNYYPVKLDLSSVILKAANETNTPKNTRKNLTLISDFQNINTNNLVLPSLTTPINFVKLTPNSIANCYIDSVYVSNPSISETAISVVLKNTIKTNISVPVSLFNNSNLIGKATATFNNTKKALVQFTIPTTSNFNGQISIVDDGLTFDNNFYFSITSPKKLNVLCIGENAEFLTKIYTENEFNFTTTSLQNLNYNTLQNQHLIILNELDNFPPEFNKSIVEYLEMNGHLAIIPSKNSDLASYNLLLETLTIGKINGIVDAKHQVTTINYQHPLLKGVFEKEVDNFQYPTIQKYYKTSFNNSTSIVALDTKDAYISSSKSKNGTLFWIASSLDNSLSNFTQSPLVVPIFYNFAKSGLTPSNLYETIAFENSIDILTSIKKDQILKIKNNNLTFIPLQKISQHKVNINFKNQHLEQGFYNVFNEGEPVKTIAFNYNTNESNLTDFSFSPKLTTNKKVTISTSIASVFNTINKEQKINWIFKWFLAFSVLFLFIEMLILKYFNK